MPVALVILFAILSIIFMPLVLLWALNTLFPAPDIPYTLSTWSASLFIVVLLTFKFQWNLVK
jgi:hypothetical protein